MCQLSLQANKPQPAHALNLNSNICFKQLNTSPSYQSNWVEVFVMQLNDVETFKPAYLKKCERFAQASKKRSLSLLKRLPNNSKLKKKCSSQYRGVYWNSGSKCWRARTWVNGKREHIGNFKEEIDAAVAVDKRATQLGRKDALNFPLLNLF